MAASLIALLDDIASVLDDVSVLAKVAAHKTAGVLGDDLALNAQQVSGVQAHRELPVVWAVAKGSFVNKSILVPLALAISALAPWAVTPLLMVGGAFLCYEGFEKLAHRLTHSRAEDQAHHHELVKALAQPDVDICAVEKEKIRAAVRTDFILSAEIIAIALGTVAGEGLLVQFGVLCAVAVAMTVGVYGVVAGIVKIDDLGFWLLKRPQAAAQAAGRAILRAAPWFMRFLTVAGTAAMFLVGGGIVLHGIGPLAHAIEAWLPESGWLSHAGLLLSRMLLGVAVGALVLAATQVFQRARARA